MFFTSTGEREVYENLRAEVKVKQDLKELVSKMSEEGDTVREIEIQLRKEGYKISKSSIRLLKIGISKISLEWINELKYSHL